MGSSYASNHAINGMFSQVHNRQIKIWKNLQVAGNFPDFSRAGIVDTWSEARFLASNKENANQPMSDNRR
jgi:hypothetical protein